MSTKQKSSTAKARQSDKIPLEQLALIICGTLMGLALLFICYIAIYSGSLGFALFSAPYLAIIASTYALLTGKVSEQLKRLLIVLNVIGGASVLYFVYFAITFPQNYTF